MGILLGTNVGDSVGNGEDVGMLVFDGIGVGSSEGEKVGIGMG